MNSILGVPFSDTLYFERRTHWCLETMYKLLQIKSYIYLIANESRPVNFTSNYNESKYSMDIDDQSSTPPNLRESNDTQSNGFTGCDPGEEDWDEEIKVNNEYKSVLLTCDQRKGPECNSTSTNVDNFQVVVNRYPPAEQAYSSTASYESFVYAKNRTNNDTRAGSNSINSDVVSRFASCAIGQFDDAD